MPHPTLDDRPAPTHDRLPAAHAPGPRRAAPAPTIDPTGATGPGVAGQTPARGSPERTSARRWPFRVEFTGSGSEYFRIWLVNALLTVVTLGAYHPRARVRRYQYFRTNTWIVFGNGERHAMDFEVDSGKSLKVIGVWMALIVASVVLYAIAPPLLGVIALVVTPWLRLKSLRYRIAGTTFRGLRFRFSGDLRGQLSVWMPMLVVAGAGLVLMLLAGQSASSRAVGPMILAVVMLAGLALWPWVQWRLVRWRQRHLGYGTLEADRFTTPVGRFYAVTIKAGLLGMLAAGGAFLALSLGTTTFATTAAVASGQSPASWGALLLASGAALLLVILPILVGVYFNTAIYNLAWGGTTGSTVRLRSRLGYGRVAGLVVTSWILTILTLGLYRPFAEIAAARLRLEAIDGVLLENPDAIVARAHAGAGAMGDLAADLLDVGDLL